LKRNKYQKKYAFEFVGNCWEKETEIQEEGARGREQEGEIRPEGRDHEGGREND